MMVAVDRCDVEEMLSGWLGSPPESAREDRRATSSPALPRFWWNTFATRQALDPTLGVALGDAWWLPGWSEITSDEAPPRVEAGIDDDDSDDESFSDDALPEGREEAFVQAPEVEEPAEEMLLEDFDDDFDEDFPDEPDEDLLDFERELQTEQELSEREDDDAAFDDAY